MKFKIRTWCWQATRKKPLRVTTKVLMFMILIWKSKVTHFCLSTKDWAAHSKKLLLSHSNDCASPFRCWPGETHWLLFWWLNHYIYWKKGSHAKNSKKNLSDTLNYSKTFSLCSKKIGRSRGSPFSRSQSSSTCGQISFTSKRTTSFLCFRSFSLQKLRRAPTNSGKKLTIWSRLVHSKFWLLNFYKK